MTDHHAPRRSSVVGLRSFVYRLAQRSCVLILLVTACAPAVRAPDDGRVRVVATFSVLGDIVGNLAGETAALTVLVGPGGDTHTFEPAPADALTLAGADVVFENGLGFEPWLNGLMESSGSRARRVVVTESLPLIETNGIPDPHVWQDPTAAATMAQTVRDALIELDPANAEAYRLNAERYLGELRALDEWIESEVGRLPPERRQLVTTHDTFAYFARRYGFRLIGTALGAATTEVAEPSAQAVGALVEAIRASGVPAIFGENVARPGVLEQIAAEAGVTLGPPLYTDALGPPGSSGETYLGMMRYNVAAMVGALR